MIAIIKRAIAPAVLALAATCGSALATLLRSASGTTRPAAVRSRSRECNGNLCGRLVWVKEADHKEGCGLQIFGDVKPVAGGKWDGGWIIDPEKDLKTRYDVEITPQGDKLKVMGYCRHEVPEPDHDLDAGAGQPARDAMRAPSCPVRPETRRRPRSDEPPTVYPPPAFHAGPIRQPPPTEPPKPATARGPHRVAKPGKDCKIEFGGVSLTFPCPE